jgi:branched-subunit amino acid ABC-type transport system permease component
MQKRDVLLMAVAAFLLLAVNRLAFHDYREAHTVRDWLTLLASLLVFAQFARVLWQQNVRRPPVHLT